MSKNRVNGKGGLGTKLSAVSTLLYSIQYAKNVSFCSFGDSQNFYFANWQCLASLIPRSRAPLYFVDKARTTGGGKGRDRVRLGTDAL